MSGPVYGVIAVSGMVFCRGRGATLHNTALACPKCGAAQKLASTRRGRSFAGSVLLCVNRYAIFAGRAPRSEYWYFMLFTVLISIGASIVDSVWLGHSEAVANGVGLAFFIPTIAVQVRRMHDLNRVGWWLWLSLVPVLGWLILLIWAFTPGTRGSNRFGDDPLLSSVPDSSAGFGGQEAA
jgi:uncharacterized membrane protein YhaH (DUF805 family)